MQKHHRSPTSFTRLPGLGVVAVLAWVMACAAVAPAQEPVIGDYMRFVDGAAPRLETSIVTMTDKAGRRVDLVAAVHVADAAYFASLEETFKSYDAVLYEMVKPRGMPPPAKRPARQATGGGRATPDSVELAAVSGLQMMLPRILELTFQLDMIDYRAANFVHADLDAETFDVLQSERGESLTGMMLQTMMRELMRGELAEGSPPTLGHLLLAAQKPDRARQFKLILARQFNDIERAMAGLDNHGKGSVILTERNKRAMDVIKQTLGETDARKIAVFYGAAHMPDLQKRLEQQGFAVTGTTWLTAWDMTPPPATRPAEQGDGAGASN